MGKWQILAKKQAKDLAPLNTRAALRLVAFWRGRRKTTNEEWRPVVKKILAEAPERKRITSRLIATDLLLNLIFGETETRPEVTAGVNAAVFAYVDKSATLLDRTRPDAPIPELPNVLLDLAVKAMIRDLKRQPFTKKKFGVAALLLLLLFASNKKRR